MSPPFPKPFGGGPWPCLNVTAEHYMQGQIFTCEISEVQRKGTTIGRFACSCGYNYRLSSPDNSPVSNFSKARVFSFGPIWEERFRELWLDRAVSLRSLCRALGLYIEAANKCAVKLKLPVPRYSECIEDALILSTSGTTKDASWYRKQWSALLEENPDEATYMLSRKVSGVYTWLRRHDKEWLDSNHPSGKLSTGRRGTGADVRVLPGKDDISQDTLLAEKVRGVSFALKSGPGNPVRVTLAKICKEIPQVRFLKAKLGEAPLTSQALHEAVETTEAFVKRRIQRVLQKYLDERIYPVRYQLIARVHIKPHTLRLQGVQLALDEAMTMLSQFA